MNDAELAVRYRALNESFSRDLVFHLGVNAGFFSEFNNLVLAVLYCLDRKIKFTLYSADANFRTRGGWRDFFEPFCPETEDVFHHRHNHRWLKIYHPHRKLGILVLKTLKGLDLLTHDVWRGFKNEAFAARGFSIPELGIEGGLLDATRVLHRIIWRYNPKTKAVIEARRAAFGLPERYVGIHVRGGDKSTEHEVYEPEKYIEMAEKVSEIRDAFVLTDDYGYYERLVENQRDWRLRTSCSPGERGYFHEEYQRLDAEAKADRLLTLFAAMDCLAGAEEFVGSYTTNPGMNIGMRLPPERVHCVDYESWRISW